MAEGTFSGGLGSLSNLVNARRAAGNPMQPAEFGGLQDQAMRSLFNPQGRAPGAGLVYTPPTVSPLPAAIEGPYPPPPISPTQIDGPTLEKILARIRF
jgi:hypothetical protein